VEYKVDNKDFYLSIYRDGLLQDTIPFWLKHGMDHKYGGLFTSLGRDGKLLDSDKAVWPQGRFAWMLATLFNTVEPKPEWRDAALSCLNFLEQHGFDSDGRMYFLLTREGKPVRKRRYAYSESFACLAYAACSKATGRSDYAQRAKELFQQFTTINFEAGHMPPKVNQETRPSKGIGPLMICLNMAQTLRDTIDFADAQMWIDRCIDEIEQDFCHPARRVVMETVSPTGEVIDHMDSRLLNPGHAIEAAGFILHESLYRGNDPRLTQLGVQMLDWMWERGWDEKHGGILYFRDLFDLPIQDYWHDMKFWWPQNETIIATLLAYKLTGSERHRDRHALVHEWAYKHFPDEECGEWFGYLHRDGSVASEMKGGHWKGPFHLPRMQWYCWKLLENS
jgi:N-acylglucosamine 2-epimerase